MNLSPSGSGTNKNNDLVFYLTYIKRFRFGFPILSLVGFRSQSRKAILPLLTLILRLLLGFLSNVKGPCAAPEGVSHNRTGTL